MSFFEMAIRAAESIVQKTILNPVKTSVSQAVSTVQQMFPMEEKASEAEVNVALAVDSAKSKLAGLTPKQQAAGLGIAGVAAAATVATVAISRRKKAPKKKGTAKRKKEVKRAAKPKARMKAVQKKSRQQASKLDKRAKKARGSRRKKEPHKGHLKGEKHRIGSGELIHFTKRGQPFIIDDKTKRPKFIPRKEVE